MYYDKTIARHTTHIPCIRHNPTLNYHTNSLTYNDSLSCVGRSGVTFYHMLDAVVAMKPLSAYTHQQNTWGRWNHLLYPQHKHNQINSKGTHRRSLPVTLRSSLVATVSYIYLWQHLRELWYNTIILTRYIILSNMGTHVTRGQDTQYVTHKQPQLDKTSNSNWSTLKTHLYNTLYTCNISNPISHPFILTHKYILCLPK